MTKLQKISIYRNCCVSPRTLSRKGSFRLMISRIKICNGIIMAHLIKRAGNSAIKPCPVKISSHKVSSPKLMKTDTITAAALMRYMFIGFPYKTNPYTACMMFIETKHHSFLSF